MSSEVLLDNIWQATVAEILATSRPPQATYRLQFHAGFTFRDAIKLVPYLEALGITDVYASPLLKARPGSEHGYDICDHTTLNPQIGTPEEFDQLAAELKSRGMGLLLDVVPNHVGIGTDQNELWADVLENGPSSPYASYFDIDWHPQKSDLHEKVLLPILGDQFGRILDAGLIQLVHDAGRFGIKVYDSWLPIAPRTAITVLEPGLDDLEGRLGVDDQHLLELRSIITGLSHLPTSTETDSARVSEGQRERLVLRRRLASLVEASEAVAEHIAKNVSRFNGTVGDPRSFDLLESLLEKQAYRLADWRVASDEINYRRFFDVNELAAITVENRDVFEHTHQLVFRLLDEGKVNGLRIDHPDGLFDPPEYFLRLQEQRFLQIARQVFQAKWSESPRLAEVTAAPAHHADEWQTEGETPNGEQADDWEWLDPQIRLRYRLHIDRQHSEPLVLPLYLIVEKILCRGESLPTDWTVLGTVGYEFMAALGSLFVDRSGERDMSLTYQRFINDRHDFAELAYECRQLIMDTSMSSELGMLGHQLDQLSEGNRYSRDFTLASLTNALREIVACFPVYRTYLDCDAPDPERVVNDRDRHFIETAVARAKRRNPAVSASIYDFIRDVLLWKPVDAVTGSVSAAQRQFVGRVQQFTPPVMAKGVEDTACYRYNRLLSLNEVGSSPEAFGSTLAAFHHQNVERANRWPRAMLASSTHDCKRSEDVRARISVLSEIPQEWRTSVRRWARLNGRKRTSIDGVAAPDRNDEYFLYQTLLGTWPLEPMDSAARAAYVERIQTYLVKALREAKRRSSWISPDDGYESAVTKFAAALLEDSPANHFLAEFQPFAARVAHAGMLAGLSQSVLKLTSPGVPDTYQGTEIWDYSLVDPDNRRPVDYARRQKMLAELDQRVQQSGGNLVPLVQELLERRADGRVKLYVVWRTLTLRSELKACFAEGRYLPLDALGDRHDHVCAFLRTSGSQSCLIVAPRFIARLGDDPRSVPLGESAWGNTRLSLSGAEFASHAALPQGEWRNIFTGEQLRAIQSADGPVLPLGSVLKHFPVAVLAQEELD